MYMFTHYSNNQLLHSAPLPLIVSFPCTSIRVSSWVDCKRVLRYRISRETTIRVIIILLLTPEESNKERHTGSPRLVRTTTTTTATNVPKSTKKSRLCVAVCHNRCSIKWTGERRRRTKGVASHTLTRRRGTCKRRGLRKRETGDEG